MKLNFDSGIELKRAVFGSPFRVIDADITREPVSAQAIFDSIGGVQDDEVVEALGYTLPENAGYLALLLTNELNKPRVEALDDVSTVAVEQVVERRVLVGAA